MMKFARASFNKYLRALIHRKLLLKLNLRLFHTFVSLIAAYGIATMPLANAMLTRINVVQRKMLRSIVSWIRYDGEIWREVMQRMNERVHKSTKVIRLMP